MYQQTSDRCSPKVALLGTYSPRHCGIATFTEHLGTGISGATGKCPVVIAMNDEGERYAYGKEVGFQIAQNHRERYVEAAQFINQSDVDVVCIQHEYGIYGGVAGDFLLEFIDALQKPFIATLHTILAQPNPDQLRVLKYLAERAESVVVMSEKGVSLLKSVFGIPADKIKMIHHGVPDHFDSVRSSPFMRRGKTLLTFGLLSPDKGIESVIQAMPEIVEKCPLARYLVVGATHPHVRAHQGEAYRQSLIDLAKRLGVSEQVVFHNHFVSQSELNMLIRDAEIYVTPYLKMEQITSGTLAYAVGSGKAIISTPYWHAEELLAEGRGVLVPCRDPRAIAMAAIELLTNDEVRESVEQKAKALGETMRWSTVSGQYVEVVRQAMQQESKVVPSTGFKIPTGRIGSKIKIGHLLAMTDDVGILQHAIYSVPRYDEGYCVDDNTRALLLTGMLEAANHVDSETVSKLASRYLAFMNFAFNRDNKAFRNFLSYSRVWLEEKGSEDSQGRSIWGLAEFAAHSRNTDHRHLALELLDRAIPSTLFWGSPRSWAYALLGLDAMHRADTIKSTQKDIGSELHQRLHNLWSKVATPEWPWFETEMTYCNGRLPQALLMGARWEGNTRGRGEAITALEFLWTLQESKNGVFEPIGSDGKFSLGAKRPYYDQQPVEATSMLSACLSAWKATHQPIWKQRASKALEWFHGSNHHGISLVDPITGACYDGLTQVGANRNQGAESTLSYMMARLEMQLALQLDDQAVPLSNAVAS